MSIARFFSSRSFSFCFSFDICMQSLPKRYPNRTSRDLSFEICKNSSKSRWSNSSKNPPLGTPFARRKKNHRYVSSLRKTIGRSVVHDRVIKNFAGTVEASIFPDGRYLAKWRRRPRARCRAKNSFFSLPPVDFRISAL